MKTATRFILIVLLITALPAPDETLASQQKFQIHEATDWQVSASFKYDALCFLNVLTADQFYLGYYGAEYAHFAPQMTPEVRRALSDLKHRIKDEHGNIISAFLSLYYSATEDETLDDMLRTLEDSRSMRNNLKRTTYYSDEGWRLFESVREDLKIIFRFLKQAGFSDYWKQNMLPKVSSKIVEVEKGLPAYNVVAEVEKLLGHALPSNRITIYMLYFARPHGIKITGTRFLTDIAWPFKIALRNAAHEMMHPPYDLNNDSELRKALDQLKKDSFLMDKVKHHNPDFGYNSFEGLIEEDIIQALDQIINENLKIEDDARSRWRNSDGGMHVFAVALYSLMKDENYNQKQETLRDFLLRIIRSGKLTAGKIKPIYDSFYALKTTN
jgi:hypothetical protein